ncbi:unnamed protein product [Ectocarpus sp. 4 AP-2014]
MSVCRYKSGVVKKELLKEFVVSCLKPRRVALGCACPHDLVFGSAKTRKQSCRLNPAATCRKQKAPMCTSQPSSHKGFLHEAHPFCHLLHTSRSFFWGVGVMVCLVVGHSHNLDGSHRRFVV